MFQCDTLPGETQGFTFTFKQVNLSSFLISFCTNPLEDAEPFVHLSLSQQLLAPIAVIVSNVVKHLGDQVLVVLDRQRKVTNLRSWLLVHEVSAIERGPLYAGGMVGL